MRPLEVETPDQIVPFQCRIQIIAYDPFGIGEDDKKKVIMVGDREHDIIGANECGIESVGVYFGYAAPGELEAAGATYIVSSMGELKQLLLELSSEAQEEEGQR